MTRGHSRRHFLASASAFPILAFAGQAQALSISGRLPWEAFAGEPPRPVNPAGWYYFTPQEVAAIEAIVDRLIPADPLSVGGKGAGCAVFIDRQLAGSFGKSTRLYMQGPFAKGLPTQGYQGTLTPAGRYREGLRALQKRRQKRSWCPRARHPQHKRRSMQTWNSRKSSKSPCCCSISSRTCSRRRPIERRSGVRLRASSTSAIPPFTS